MLILRLILYGAATLLLLSFLGMVHPIGDSLAVFRLPLAAFLAVLAVICFRRRVAIVVGLLVAAASGASVLWAYSAPDDQQRATLTVYQKNLSFRPGDRSALLDDLRALQPDLITLQEVHERHLPLIELLSDLYPNRAVCSFAAVGGVAILSRLPLASDDVRCESGLGIVALPVQSDQGPLWAVSVHQHWPWPHHQEAQARRIIAVLDELDGPKVMAGDFNMVAWSYNLKRYAETTATLLAGPFDASFELEGLLGIRIDHVLAPKGGKTRLRPYFGSDHRGLFAEVAL